MTRPEGANYGAGVRQCDHTFGPSGDFASVACIRVYGHKGRHLDYWEWRDVPLRFRRKRHRRVAGK